MKLSLTKFDKIQILLNLIGFVFLLQTLNVSKGAFATYATMSLTLIIAIIEFRRAQDQSTVVIMCVKLFSYFIISCFYYKNEVELSKFNIVVGVIAILTFLLSIKLKTNRWIFFVGSTINSALSGVLFINAVLALPSNFGIWHFLFWSINAVSYVLLTYQHRISIKPKQFIDYCFSISALLLCLVYATIIYLKCISGS